MCRKNSIEYLHENYEKRIQVMQLRRQEQKAIANQRMSERDLRVGMENIASMRDSKAYAIQMLDHEDPEFRMVALSTLEMHWRLSPDETCVAKIEAMSSSDPDINVRMHSLETLGTCFTGTDDSRIGKYFASILLDENNPKFLRYFSYYGLLRLKRRSILRMVDFPDDINYEYVQEFLKDDRKPNPISDDLDEENEISTLSKMKRFRDEIKARREKKSGT